MDPSTLHPCTLSLLRGWIGALDMSGSDPRLPEFRSRPRLCDSTESNQNKT